MSKPGAFFVLARYSPMDIVSVIVILAALAIAWLIITRLPLPPTVRLVVEVVIGILCIVWLLSLVGVGGHSPLHLGSRC